MTIRILEAGRSYTWTGLYSAALLFAARRTLRGLDCRAVLS